MGMSKEPPIKWCNNCNWSRFAEGILGLFGMETEVPLREAVLDHAEGESWECDNEEDLSATLWNPGWGLLGRQAVEVVNEQSLFETLQFAQIGLDSSHYQSQNELVFNLTGQLLTLICLLLHSAHPCRDFRWPRRIGIVCGSKSVIGL